MTLTLKNEGKGDIIHADGVLPAGKFGAVSDKVAAVLLALYPQTVVSLDKMREELKEVESSDKDAEPEEKADDAPKAIEEMLLPELMAYAQSLGLEIKAGTAKAKVKEAIEEKLADLAAQTKIVE